MIKSIDISETTAQQRLDYVRNFLNLDVTGNESDAAITAKISQAQPNHTMIFYQEADGEDAPEHATPEPAVPLKPEEQAGRIAGSLGKDDPKAIIRIAPLQDEDDGIKFRDVVVGVNGRAWQLMRGVDITVPWRVVEALQNAEQDTIRHSQEEGREGEVVATKTLRHNFSILDRPPQAEIDAWLERTGAEFCA